MGSGIRRSWQKANRCSYNKAARVWVWDTIHYTHFVVSVVVGFEREGALSFCGSKTPFVFDGGEYLSLVKGILQE